VNALEPVSIETTLAWIDGATRRLEAEEVSLDRAGNRVLAADLRAHSPIPAADCAAIDGFAVFAFESLGAGTYNPLVLSAVAVEAGEALPPGTDAVVPFDHAEPESPGRVVLVEPIAPGANLDRRGAVAASGAVLVRDGTRLAPRHLGMLAAAGFTSLPVIRRPLVRLVIAATARSAPPIDSNGPMLRALIARDGGIVVEGELIDVFAAGADMIVMAGGAGRGDGDHAVGMLATQGSLDIRGVALIPGETASFGRTSAGAAAILLPGAPAACLWNYELFVGRAVRRLGGCDPDLPYRSSSAITARKIVSSVGITEICAIRRLGDGRIEPVASFAEAGLMAAIEADGFVIVPAASEGYPAGATVTAYFYQAC
jgi:molybdopterin molybdotransferase